MRHQCLTLSQKTHHNEQVAAECTGRPVKMQLSIYQDQQATGARHPVLAKYTVAFDATGVVSALQIDSWLDGGT